MEKDLCTIIIPAYNHETYIAECLTGVINQTYENIELIIINDGSTDGTDDIIRSYKNTLENRFKNYKYISKENEGICKTLNFALDLINGEYISIIASDDVMLPDKTLKQIDFLKHNPQFGLVFSDEYEVPSKEGEQISLKHYDDSNKRSNKYDFFNFNNTEGTTLDKLLTGVFAMPTPTVMYRKELYDTVGKYDQSLECEDPDMFLRMAFVSEFGYLPESLVLHRVHDKNSSQNGRLYPSIYKMYLKYKDVKWLNQAQKEVLKETFLKILKTNVFFSQDCRQSWKSKKLIVWGTGSKYQNSKIFLNDEIEFFIDNNEAKAGKLLDGKNIYLPSKLEVLDKDKYFIVIASTFKEEIENVLNNMGYKKGIHFK